MLAAVDGRLPAGCPAPAGPHRLEVSRSFAYQSQDEDVSGLAHAALFNQHFSDSGAFEKPLQHGSRSH